MPLPDLSGLVALPPETLRAFGRRLAAVGLTLPCVAPIVAAVQPIPPPLRRPIRAFHLRRIQHPAGYAMRMFLFGDPVSPDEALTTLGDLLDPLLSAGLLTRTEDGAVVSPFVLSVVDDLYILADDLSQGGDAVMGLGDTTAKLCRAALPEAGIGRALDLGCGSGTAALVLSRNAREVVATDINPRAVALGKVNAAINGISNVDFREGDLFAPVVDETFDLIVSQPPFVPMPEGVAGSTLLYGGRRGDELALRLLAEVTPRLAPGGRATLVIEWPVGEGPPIEDTIRGALGSAEADLLVLQCPPLSPDEHAAAYASGTHPELGAAFEQEALLRREHLDRLGVQGLSLTFTILARATQPPGWTWVLPVAPLAKLDVSSRKIDRLFAGRRLIGDPERLLAAALRVPEGTVLAQEQVGPGAEQPSTLSVRFAEEGLIQPVQLNEDALLLITFLHEADTAREGIARFAAETGGPAERAEVELVPGIEEMMLAGLLEVV